MKLIDSIVEAFSPQTALVRRAAREALAYEASKKSRTHQAKRQTRAAAVSIEQDARSLREQARALDEDHDIVIGLLDKLEERIVGPRGIQIEPQPRDMQGVILSDLAADIRRRFAAWSLAPEVTGQYTRPQMERLICRSWLRDGEVFGKRIRGTVPGMQYPTGTQFAIECLEADFIPLDYSDEGAGIRQGVRLNAWGKPTTYYTYDSHPGDSVGWRFRMRQQDAADIYHLALRRRLHQIRGVSILHGVITRLSDLKSVEEAERVAARISASLAFYIRRGDPSLYRGDAGGPQRMIDIAPGMTFDDLRPGEDVGVIQSNRPNTGLNIWREGQLRSVAAGARSSYSSIARDYKGSYSSQRQELVEGAAAFDALQDEFVSAWARPVYRDWLEMETLRTDDPLILPPDLDLRTLFDAQYMGPVMPWIDPSKESDAWKTRIRGGAASVTQWIRAGGENPDEVRALRQSELDFYNAVGIVTDTDPANDKGAASEPTQPPPSDPSTDDAASGNGAGNAAG